MEIIVGCIIGIFLFIGVRFLIIRFQGERQPFYFKPRRLYFGIIIGIISLFLTYNSDISKFVIILFWSISVFFIIFAFYAKPFYCSDCGQYLGADPGVCPRCGCNIYTSKFAGVGSTFRNGGKNF